MQNLSLTKHFEERWIERVGNWPTPEAVSQFVAQSVKVQPCRDLLRPDGRPYRILAIYWHPDLDLVIKIDEFDRAAVTVFSRDLYTKRNLAAPAPAPADSALARRIARLRAAFGFNPR